MDNLMRRISSAKMDVQAWRNRSGTGNGTGSASGSASGSTTPRSRGSGTPKEEREKMETPETKEPQSEESIYTVLKRPEKKEVLDPGLDNEDDDTDENHHKSKQKIIMSILEGKSDEELLKLWLTELHLEFLVQVFIANNMSFENIKLYGLTEDNLDDLGIKKELYKTKLLRNARKLRENNGRFSIKEKETDHISMLQLTLTNIVTRDDGKKKKDTDDNSVASRLSNPSFIYADGKWNGFHVRIARMDLTYNADVFDREISSIRKFSIHPNLLKLHGIVSINTNNNTLKKKKHTGPSAQYLVWEQCNGEYLDSAITRMKNERKDKYIFGDQRGAVKVLLGIAQGMCHLHSKAIVHGKLTTANVIVQFDYSTKLADYGIQKFTDSQKISKKRDVANFGMIMWQLFNDKELPKSLGEHTEDKFPKKIRHIFRGCVEEDPKERLSFQDIVLRLGNFYNNFRVVKTTKVGEADTSSLQLALEHQAEEKNIIIAGLTAQIDHKSADITRLKAELANYQSPEKRVTEVFSSERSYPWEEFVHIFLTHFAKASIETVTKLKTVLANNGIVERKSWCDFADWFAPYSHSYADLHLEDVADIVGSEWFYGFITPFAAEDLLLNRPEGTYLIRFSTNPGCYALSVNYGRVGHWRIVVEELNAEHPVLKIDERLYKSVAHIIETHKTGGEPLEIKRPTVRNCWLTKPANKFDGGEHDIYYGNPLAD